MARFLLFSFVVLKLAIALVEHGLAAYNWRFVRDPGRQARAAALLGISNDDMQRSARYSFDRYRFGLVQSWLSTGALLVFVVAGGLGLSLTSECNSCRQKVSGAWFVETSCMRQRHEPSVANRIVRPRPKRCEAST